VALKRTQVEEEEEDILDLDTPDEVQR
jgi:hypothetical protein